jgi:hypothetical protein
VQDDMPDLVSQLVGIGTGEALNWAAVDADLVGKDPGVGAAPSGQRYTPVQTEQALSCWWFLFDDDLDVGEGAAKIGWQKPDRLPHGLSELVAFHSRQG